MKLALDVEIGPRLGTGPRCESYKFTAYANLLHLPCMKSNNYQGGGLPDILHLYSDKSDLKDVKIQPLTRVVIYEAPYQGGKALSE